MTEFEIASAIENHVTSSEGVTDFALDTAQVRDEVDTYRIRLLNQIDAQSQLRAPFEGYIQRLKLQVQIEAGTNRRYVDHPLIFFRWNGKPAISFGGSTTYNTQYRIIHGNHHQSFNADKYLGGDPTLWVRKEKTYIFNIAPEHIMLDAIYEDPSDVPGYDYRSDKYPVPANLIDEIIGKSAKTIISSHYNMFPQPNTQSNIPTQPNNK